MPELPAAKLSDRALRGLDREPHRVLRESNRRARIPPEPSWLTGVRDERNPHCPRCGSALRRARLGGRTTVWCPRCQRS